MDKATIIRIVLLALALINQVLVINGYSPLSIDEEVIENLISSAFVIVMACITTWKNNSFTKEAKQSDAKLKQLKAEKKLAKVSGKSPVKENIDTEGDI